MTKIDKPITGDIYTPEPDQQASFVEDTQEDFIMDFTSNNKTSTIVIKGEDIHKLARAFYDFCIDNKIKADINIK